MRILMSTIAVFDFLSHEFMHHPFNEGYLRTLRAAFADDRIVFYARQGHIDQLAQRFAAADRIEFRPCPAFAVPFGLTRHNPIGGRIAARRCWQAAVRSIAGTGLRMAAVLGVDANLYATFSACWPAFSQAPLHMIQHDHLSVAANWRSRNPFIRAFDLLTVMQRPLPPNVRLVTLELGIRDAVAALAPALSPSIETLEHPVLVSEWAPKPSPAHDDEPLRVAFVGHASVAKGFDLFAEWARRHARPGLEFHAIGIGSTEVLAMDLSGLARRPAMQSVSRPDYIEALAACDLVCLPLPPPIYEYVASGSVIDAIVALKPLFSIRNRSLDAIAANYGTIGHLAENAEALGYAIGRLDRRSFAAERDRWTANLLRLRAARRPEALAPGYAATITAAAERDQWTANVPRLRAGRRGEILAPASAAAAVASGARPVPYPRGQE
jgi:glycosyltransferase involved in cell wall biosynthesis